MIELGLIGNNSLEQIRKEQDVKIISKETWDRIYRCKGGFHHILRFWTSISPLGCESKLCT
jgi:hypothetical protein